jgi:hypothetical protein
MQSTTRSRRTEPSGETRIRGETPSKDGADIDAEYDEK